MKRLTWCGLLFSLVYVAVADFAAAQPGRRPGANSRQENAPRLPEDPRLMALHKSFVTDATKLATEYERAQDWNKAKSVYQEILKLVPEYPPAKAKLEEMLSRLGTAKRVLIDVDAAKGWQNTGVIVLAGQPITIRAAGRWTLVGEVGPAGVQLPKEVMEVKEVREARLGSLLAAVNTGNSKEDKPFVIGLEKSYTPDKPGQLYLMMHDIDHSDNQGSIKVEIMGTFEQQGSR